MGRGWVGRAGKGEKENKRSLGGRMPAGWVAEPGLVHSEFRQAGDGDGDSGRSARQRLGRDGIGVPRSGQF